MSDERFVGVRCDPLVSVFYDDGGEGFEPGEFRVKEVTTDNSFICSRLFGDKGDEVFDIGYVIRRIRIYEEE